VRRPLLVVSVAAALGAAGTALATGLTPSTAIDTFVEGSSPTYRATNAFYRGFGSEPVDVVVKGDLQRLLLSSDVERLLGLEGCLAGRLSGPSLAAGGGAEGPCGQLAKTRAAKVVIGPATFINEAALEIDDGLVTREREAARRAAAAERAVRARALAKGLSGAEASSLGRQAGEVETRAFEAEVAALAVRYGLGKPPSLGEREFVSTLVFDNASKTPGTPKQRFAYLFPSRDAALISVRLKAGLDQRQNEAAIAEIRKAVAMPQWHLGHGESYLVTGEPAILDELSSSISHSILVLLVAAAVAMALALGLVFRGRPRLAPLCIALLSTAIVFGGLALTGRGLSVAEVAVLPILIGLAVDYAIQLQSRAEEAIADGSLDLTGATIAAARSGGPAIAAAAAASGGAMLVLELSPVPTVRGFAVLLVIGLAVALLCAVTVGSAIVVLLRGGTGGAAGATRDASGGVRRDSLGWLRASWRGAEELVRANAWTRMLSKAALELVPSSPRLVLAIGAACAALGWGLSSLTPVQTDITKLVPQSTPSLRNLATLERLSGVGGEIDLTLTGRNLVKPSTIEWMRNYQSRMLARFGYREGRGCGKAPLCPALSLPDLLSGGGAGGSNGAHKLSEAEVNGFLASVPAYFSQEVISPDRREATLAFGLKLMPLSRQQQIVEAMRSALRPPPGVRATLVGLPVLAAAADAQVASAGQRTLQLLLGLLAVAVVLLIAFKADFRRALVPLVPVALASGWSALLLLVFRLPLNPMSATLGALVVAISTEFSVLLSERCREELHDPRFNDGLEVSRALRATFRGTGVAVAASAVTAIAGFGVLVLSDIAMLRDFGFATLIDLTVSLMGVLIVLPATLTLAYGRQRKRAAAPGSAWRRRSGARDGISA
jgi:hydrophobe/amphiphile efflux-3 (HAE3) family protein